MNNLIFDIGIDKGYDTQFYLDKGFKVIAVDANPASIIKIKKKFAREISQGRLIPLHYAIAEKNDEIISFYVNKISAWSSAIEDVAKRQHPDVLEEKVKTITMARLIELYGTPLYCKIDIEGYDGIALKSLIECQNKGLPKYLSSEIESLLTMPKSEKEKTTMWHERVEQLHNLGYLKFKLIDQYSLREVIRGFNIYKEFHYNSTLLKKIINKSSRLLICIKSKLSFNLGYLSDASGPFGDELSNDWHSYEAIKEIISEHGENMTNAGINVMWSDIHATF